MSLQSVQALLGDAAAPHPDRTLGQTKVAGDADIRLTSGRAQADPGALGSLPGAGSGSHTTLQLGALGRQQPNPATTWFGHLNDCEWTNHFEAGRQGQDPVHTQPTVRGLEPNHPAARCRDPN
jgi:hypothetical protein